MVQAPLTLSSIGFPGAAQDNLFGSGFCYKDCHGNDDTIDIDKHRLGHLQQIRPIAIGSDHRPVGTFPPDDELSGDLFTDHADHRSAIEEHRKFVPVYLSKNSWRGPGVPEFGLSSVILQVGEDRHMSDSDFHLCGLGPGSNSFVFGN